jgi:hypothetical protein
VKYFFELLGSAEEGATLPFNTPGTSRTMTRRHNPEDSHLSGVLPLFIRLQITAKATRSPFLPNSLPAVHFLCAWTKITEHTFGEQQILTANSQGTIQFGTTRGMARSSLNFA